MTTATPLTPIPFGSDAWQELRLRVAGTSAVVPANCDICGHTFTPKVRHQVYCGPDCVREADNARMRRWRAGRRAA